MRNAWRSMIALICSLSLLLGMVPAVVFADTETRTVEAEETPISDALDLSSLTEEDILGEEESRREANVKHFKLIDGSMVAVSYPVAVHEEVNGEWEEIDNSLTSKIDAEGDVVQATAAQNVRFSFVNGKGNRRLMKVEDTRSDARIVFELVDADKKELILSEAADSEELFAVSGVVQKGTFTNILPDTDIEYLVAGTGLKENIVVKNADAVRELSFILHCKNVTASLKEDNSVVFTDTDGETVFTIPAPFMIDAARVTSDAVAVTLEPHQKGYLYTMTPDTAWTSDPSRVYPVTIDPMVKSYSDPAAIQSAMVKESQPTAAAGDESYFWVGNNTQNTTCYGLVKFPLPTLTAADYVVHAQVVLASSAWGATSGWSPWDSAFLDGSMVLEAHKVEGAWNESTVSWNDRPSFEPAILDAVRLTAEHAYSAEGHGVVLSMTDAVNEWYQTPNSNHGVLLKLNNEDNHWFAAEFCSDLWMMYPDENVLSVQPHIYVSYRSKVGLEDAFSYTSASAGSAGTGYVQLNAGNLVFVHEDISLQSETMPVLLSHVYNTCNLDDLGYGEGWRLNYLQTVRKETIGGETYHTYTDADGTKHYFNTTETASEYKAEYQEIEHVLTFENGKPILTDKQDNRLEFSADGRLTAVKNAYGKSVTLEYNQNGTLMAVADGLGRRFTLHYASGHLASITAPDRRTVSYTYSGGTLTEITHSDGRTATFTSDANSVLLSATDENGNRVQWTRAGDGTASRVRAVDVGVMNDGALTKTAHADVVYDLHYTTVKDEADRTVTYQFNAYGNTCAVYNDHGQAQYSKYYIPNAQNPDGASTYGVNKLEYASQTHWVVNNRLYDHGFETQGKWQGNFDQSTWEPCEGLNSLRFNNRTSQATKTVTQSVPMSALTKGATYTLSAQVRVYEEVADSDTSVLFVDTGAGTPVLGTLTLSRNTAWHAEQLTFTLPSNTTASNVRVVLQKTGAGLMYVDNIQLEEGAAPNRYNLLQNSDLSYYESNYAYPYGWALSSNGTAGVQSVWAAPSGLGLNTAHYRTTSWKYANAGNTTQAIFSSTLSQTVSVGSQGIGTTMSYGGWMQADSLPERGEGDLSTFGIRVELYDGNTLVQTQYTPANRFSEEWQFVGDVVVAKLAFSKVKFSFVYENNVNVAQFDGAFVYADYFGQSYRYDDEGNVISAKAYADQQAAFEYDADDNLTAYVSPGGSAFGYTYNDYHDVNLGTSAEGVTYAYRYEEDANAADRGVLRDAQTVLGTAVNTVKTDTVYEDFKTITTVTDVRGETVTYTYNPDGTVQETCDAVGNRTNYTYDARGRVTKVEAFDKENTPLSEVSYTYDSHSRLATIQNGAVVYRFVYDAAGRTTAVSVGNTDGVTNTLVENSYITDRGGVCAALVRQSCYGNGDTVSYTYDDWDRVVAVRYEDDTADRFTYTYDREGRLVAVTDQAQNATVRYEYDLDDRLSKITTDDGYALTYSYALDNTLSAVKESFGGVEQSTRYVYNKDNQITKATSPTGSTVQYRYSYDRRENRYVQGNLKENTATFGFAPQNATVTLMDSMETPVPTQKAVKLTRTASGEVSNEHALKLRSLFPTHRYAVAAWVRASEGASGTIDLSLRFSNTALSAQTQSFAIAGGNSEWKYIEALFTVPENVYGATADYVTPTLAWNSTEAVGTVEVAGFTVTEEFEQLVVPGDLTVVDKTSGVTVTEVSDATAPLPSMPIRAWTKTGTASEGISLSAAPLASSTPEPGDVWELTFYAKLVSGSQGDGFTFRFRGYNATGTAMNRDVSNDAQIDLIEDDQWHRYTAYVTIADDAYAYGDEIYPHFGWRSSTANGTVHMNGVTVRKVGNQWSPYVSPIAQTVGVTATSALEENAPIAYQPTWTLENTATATKNVSLPLATMPQPLGATEWTLSFWVKTEGDARLVCYSPDSGMVNTALPSDGRWHYVTKTLDGVLSEAMLALRVPASGTVQLSGMSLVPGSVPLATESDQNSAALKNITIDTGSTKFNTAIEYDTDDERRAYSRVKHYINQGEAFSYSYDTDGNISSIQNPDGSYVTYTYDSLNQLVSEHYSTTVGDGSPVPHNTITYEYDARGNILSKVYSLNGETVDTVVYTYGTQSGVTLSEQSESNGSQAAWADVLTNFNGTSISYDQIGNPLNWHDGATLSWKHGRQLASYSLGDTSISYVYNQDGIRISKTVNGVNTSYNVIDGTLRRMTSGENTLEFINGTSVLFNGTEYWYVFNAQNDVIGLINQNGEYVVEYTYDAWGNILSQTDSDLARLNPFRYRGYIYDEETGWYYCQTRYYDPVVGRWLNADGYLTTDSSALGSNMYVYCGNNPIINADPTGEWLVWLIPLVIPLFFTGCSDRNSNEKIPADEAPVLDIKSATPKSFNCFGNGVVRQTYDDPPNYERGESAQSVFNKLAEWIGEDDIRLLDTIDDPIYEGEVKVALRCGDTYHFIRETADGWYNKSGGHIGVYLQKQAITAEVWYARGIHPDTGRSVIDKACVYDGPIVYYALKIDWDVG